jgi:hypothetical protein
LESFSAVKQMQTPERASCPPGFAPCDFFLFLEWKSLSKGTYFHLTDDVYVKSRKLLQAVPQSDFRGSFEAWKVFVERCVASDWN